MHRKVLTLTVFSVLALGLIFALPSTAQSFLDDLDPTVRKAASDAFTSACNAGGSVDYSTNGIPGLGSAEGRRAGLSCQRTDMLSGAGDPFLGVNASADAQAYADAALAENSPSASLERRFARAQAAILALLDGFAIVPGGPSEAFNRIQTCLAGDIETNQDDLVVGVALDCGDETVRRAVAELVAAGWYVQHGSLVGFGCADMLAQANDGSNVSTRWAGALAYVQACDADLASLAAGSGELAFAAVAPLAAAGGASGSGGNLGIANAYATGLSIGNTVTVNASGNPTAGSLGNLFDFSLSNFGSVAALQAHAPLARHFFGPGEVRINIVQNVSGASLPLIGTVLLRD